MILHSITSLIKDCLHKLKFLQYKYDLPVNQKQNDVYLVEFPKSGVTRLSTLIANVTIAESNDPHREVTFFNISQYVHDIHESRYLPENSTISYPGYRFIKSHATFNPHYNFVIYLARNPFSVMESYFHFLSAYHGYSGTFMDFVKHKKYGITAWVKHFESRMQNTDSTRKIHFLRYEDLKTDTNKAVKLLYGTLGLLVSDKNINDAVVKSHFDQMKKMENLYAESNPTYTPAAIRKGKIKADEMSTEAYEFIKENTNHILKKYRSSYEF